jgi:hypothetical protein
MRTLNSIETKTPGFPDKELPELLSIKINDLSLQIQGTWLGTLVNQLYLELERAGIAFKPGTYLSDEWGCPHNLPVIGIPFYLADPKLRTLEGQMTGVEAETEAEVMMYLRHEAGHAFNYAYRLYDRASWQRTFGKYSQPYHEIYRTVPFSTSFVHHVPGWYAQKHPDDDFAETFAVWLTPGSQWRDIYKGTPALAKLLYVDRLARRYGNLPPTVRSGPLDRPVQELDFTLDTYYKSCQYNHCSGVNLPEIINEDLRRLFPDQEGQPVVENLQAARGVLAKEVNYWTGLDRKVCRSLLDELLDRIQKLSLKINPESVNNQFPKMAVFLTVLAMNYQYTGKFVE